MEFESVKRQLLEVSNLLYPFQSPSLYHTSEPWSQLKLYATREFPKECDPINYLIGFYLRYSTFISHFPYLTRSP